MQKLTEHYPPFYALIKIRYNNKTFIGKRTYKDGQDQLRFCPKTRYFGRELAKAKHFFDLSVPFTDPNVLWDFVDVKDLCCE